MFMKKNFINIFYSSSSLFLFIFAFTAKKITSNTNIHISEDSDITKTFNHVDSLLFETF
jgi:hypothetical protein